MKAQQQTDTIKFSPWLIGSIVIGLATITGIVIYVVRKPKTGNFSNKTESGTNSTDSFKCQYKGYPVRYGSCGNEVKILQKHLNKQGASVDVDGRFGPLTKTAALKYLQSEKFGQSFIRSLSDEKIAA